MNAGFEVVNKKTEEESEIFTTSLSNIEPIIKPNIEPVIQPGLGADKSVKKEPQQKQRERIRQQKTSIARESVLVDDPVIVNALQNPSLLAFIQSVKGSGIPLSVSDMEALGMKTNVGVLIHTDPMAHFLCSLLDAKAFALQQEIFFSKGSFQLDTEEGKSLLTHELLHVAQGTSVVARQVKEDKSTFPISDPVVLDILKQKWDFIPEDLRRNYVLKFPELQYLEENDQKKTDPVTTPATTSTSLDSYPIVMEESAIAEQVPLSTSMSTLENHQPDEQKRLEEEQQREADRLKKWTELTAYQIVAEELHSSWKSVKKEFQSDGSMVANLFIKEKLINGWRPGDGMPSILTWKDSKKLLHIQAWTFDLAMNTAKAYGMNAGGGNTFVWETPWLTPEQRKAAGIFSLYEYRIAKPDEQQEYEKAKALAKEYHLPIPTELFQFIKEFGGSSNVYSIYYSSEISKIEKERELQKPISIQLTIASRYSPENPYKDWPQYPDTLNMADRWEMEHRIRVKQEADDKKEIALIKSSICSYMGLYDGSVRSLYGMSEKKKQELVAFQKKQGHETDLIEQALGELLEEAKQDFGKWLVQSAVDEQQHKKKGLSEEQAYTTVLFNAKREVFDHHLTDVERRIYLTIFQLSQLRASNPNDPGIPDLQKKLLALGKLPDLYNEKGDQLKVPSNKSLQEETTAILPEVVDEKARAYLKTYKDQLGEIFLEKFFLYKEAKE
ncbi:MAG: DUF4157 domain-containing protein, partial [Cytophagaceae bacterium]|nr:DUF4157 domain-containing protein [Cytophagaceae bacterium]